ncbi:MAG: serine/threonine-protein kinase [Acidobacteriota bacterium]
MISTPATPKSRIEPCAPWTRVEALWAEAAALPTGERSRWLAAACEGDAQLRREVEQMLPAGEWSEDGLEALVDRVAVDLAARADDSAVPTRLETPPRPAPRRRMPARVGRIRVEGRLGEGGMGVVYWGVDEALQRRVAIKTLRGPAGDPARLRLRREAELLSSLEHPNICRLYDLVHHEGDDYLILELIEGRTLEEILTEDGAPSRALGLQIAQAIAEVLDLAHRSGIVHRDLKASNVMVTEDGEVKVLDFGIARTAEGGGSPGGGRNRATLTGRDLTRQGAVVGSLATMSPEQARGESVTPASDVFSFGLLLQQLWTGKKPRRGDTDYELLRLAMLGEARQAKGLSRDQSRLIDRMKSLEADERPASSEVVAEIRHMRARQPRWLRRGAALLAALFFTALAVKYTVDLRRERDRALVAEAQAQSERQATDEVADFLLDLIGSSDPRRVKSTEETEFLRRLVEESARDLERLDDAPLAKVRVGQALAEAYLALDAQDRAVELLEEGLETLEKNPGISPLEKAWSLQLLSHASLDLGDMEASEELARQSLGIYEAFPEADPILRATAIEAVGHALCDQAKLSECERLMRRSLDLVQREGEAADAIPVLMTLSEILLERQNLEAASEAAESALKLIESHLGTEHGRYGSALENLATIEAMRGRNEEALPLFERALEITESRFGESHSFVGELLLDMQLAYGGLERWDEAEAAVRRAVRILRETLGPDHWITGAGLQELSWILDHQGEHAEAKALLLESVQIADRALGAESLGASMARQSLAENRKELGRLEESEALYRKVIDSYARIDGADGWRVGEAEAGLASVLAARDRKKEASELFDRALAKIEADLGADHPISAELTTVRATLLGADRP